ncbi:hypothetical protein Tdes44962_MAKER10192 [Teratosphaeria destructans]|uniref:Uncharacterized protein n=1 Tax=Teratosphaeria destructans TaxID=418781 RepID=A0A9W7SN85_9PEZI|nr:hypothetical protein Tdes44962_MAKER10192 [Teratosphaeria destructans]
MTQFVQRQPRYWKTKPPTTGPMAGPFMGPMLQIEKARARWWSSVMSLREPGALLIRADAQKAAQNRETRMVAMSSATAQGITQTTNRALATM